MPKPRKKENRGLPERWVLHHGAYYYYVPKGLEAQWDGKKKFLLGRSLPEAYSVFANRVEVKSNITTVGKLLDRYLLEVVPTKAPATQRGNLAYIKKLRSVFAATPLTPFPPRYVYLYVDKRDKKVAAHREVEVLSHAFTKAVEWGLLDRHPFKGEVRLEGEAPRDRLVADWEIAELRKLSAPTPKGGVAMLKAYIELKLLTGMSRGDMLRLQPAKHFTEAGIEIQRHKTARKTGKRTCYQWTPALREAVEIAKATRPVDISPYLFCNRKGGGYINEATGEPAGFKSMWQRFTARVLEETKVSEPFTEHDLRAKVGSEAESLEQAMELLSHSDMRTTKRVYRRKVAMVKPLK